MLDKFGKLSRMDPESLSCLDVVKCIHNLTDTDILILDNLPRNEAITAQDVSKLIGKDRSTAHRGLEKLVACGVCYKEKRAGTPRGYSNYYHRVPDRELYKMTEESLDKCYAKVKKALKKIDNPY